MSGERADMTYSGGEFRSYLQAFKEFFDIPTDRAATDKIAQIMELILPVQRADELDSAEIVVLPPVMRQTDVDALDRGRDQERDGRGGWDGGVLNV